jgi:phage-related minor tail protein
VQDADATAAVAMRKTEAIVKEEIEAVAVYNRVKEAVEAAEKTLAQMKAPDEAVMSVDLEGDVSVAAAEDLQRPTEVLHPSSHWCTSYVLEHF